MASYAYRAVNLAGRQVKGTVEADNEDQARSELRHKDLTVTEIKEQGFLSRDLNIQIGGWPTPRDLSVMCRQFVAMTRAGVTIIDALRMLGEQTENDRLRDALKEVRTSVEKGESLALALAEHPKVFPSLMINMTEAGEASGSLDTAMDRMATQFERSSRTQALVKKAMIYPIAVLIIAIAVSVVMLIKVIPTYEDMFADLGTDLPGITKMYVAMSDGLIHYWYVIVPVVAVVIVGVGYFAKTNTGKHIFGMISMKLPVIKNLTIKSASSMMARTMGTLMGAGVPLVEAVGIVSGVMSNVWFKEALEDAKEEIMIGMPFSRPLEECGLFPPMVYHMTRIGEEAGSTEEMLDKLADYYDEEVEMAVQSLTAAMEPMIIIVLAVVVGGLLAACMAPMLTMYESLNSL